MSDPPIGKLIHDLVGGHLIGEAFHVGQLAARLNGAGSATITTLTALLEDALGGPVRGGSAAAA